MSTSRRQLERFTIGMLAWICVGCASEPPSPAAGQQPSPPSETGEPPLSPRTVETVLEAAREYLGRNELASAETVLAELIEKAPKQARARELYGQVLSLRGFEAQKQGDTGAAESFFERAYRHYRAAVELEPDSAGLQHSAGMMAWTAGEAEAALEHFQQAARLDPDDTRYPLNEAQLLIQNTRYAEAQQALLRVLALDPDEAFAHASLAVVAMEQARLDEALEHAQQARRIDPADVQLRVIESKVRRRRDEPRRALELLVGLPEDRRADEAVAFEIAAAYTMRQEHARAAEAWMHRYHRHQLAPTAWRAAAQVAESLLAAGRPEEAYLWYRQAKLSAPEAPEIAALAEALRRAGAGD